jgi:hypothetical protein
MWLRNIVRANDVVAIAARLSTAHERDACVVFTSMCLLAVVRLCVYACSQGSGSASEGFKDACRFTSVDGLPTERCQPCRYRAGCP